MIEYKAENENTCWKCLKICAKSAFPVNTHQELRNKLCKHCSANISGNLTAHNRNAKKWGVEGHLASIDWLQILHKSNGYCYYCQKLIGFDHLVIEHMIPMVAGGSNTPENIVASCAQCNVKKARRSVEKWQQSRETELLLTTLQDRLNLPKDDIINLALKTLYLKAVEVQEEGKK